MIRALKEEDLCKIAEIHKRDYQEEFDLPDFTKNFLCCFTYEKDGEIISAGGVKFLLEVILVTDKSKSALDRKEALTSILDTSIFLADKEGFDSFHVFVDPGKYERRLRRTGFEPVKGTGLILKF